MNKNKKNKCITNCNTENKTTLYKRNKNEDYI